MRVVTTEPFQLVYTIIDIDYIGTVLEPHVVQMNGNGQLSLTHQRVFSQTAHSFSEVLDEIDFKIIDILDEMSPEALFRRFRDIAQVPKKNIKTADFFRKYYNDNLHQLYGRPFIEKKIKEALELMTDKPLYLTGKDGNPASRAVHMEPEQASVLFHFRRNEEGTRYFATIKHKGIRVDYMKPETRIICNHPARILVDQTLLQFPDEVEAKRLSPFLKQKWVEVKPQSEEKYFKTFVVPLLERFDVQAEGFEVINEKATASPTISLQHWNERYYLSVGFQYGDQYFSYNSSKKVHVKLETKGNHFVFHKIRRAANYESTVVGVLEKLGLKLYEGSLFSVASGDLYQTLEWLSLHKEELLSQGFKIEQNLTKKYFIGSQQLSVDFTSENDWFDLNVVIMFGSFQIPFLQLKKYILSGIREFELPNGDIAVIPESWFAQYAPLFEFSSEEDGSMRLKKHHVGLLQALWKSDEHRKETWTEKLKKYSEAPPELLPVRFKAELRNYQRAGFDWFCMLKKNGFGGILADDMGLGKTIQTLCLLQKEKELQETAPILNVEKGSGKQHQTFDLFSSNSEVLLRPNIAASLLVVPTSLLHNWKSEASKFAPELNILLHAGTHRTKNMQLFSDYDLIITSYGILRSDADLFREFNFHYIILDESQAAKNPQSVTARALLKLRSNHRIALTGTPVENSVTDLWTQMNFVNPGLLGSYHYFQENFALPIEKEHNIEVSRRLQQLIQPFVLRRTKEMVATDLPEKVEFVRYCEMDSDQQELYDETKSFYRNELLKNIEEANFIKNKLSVLQGLTKLRLIANHPILTDEQYEGSSTKFHDVVHMTQNALSHGHKIILFSQFVKHLAVYKKYFDTHGIVYEYLDGSSSSEERKKSVDRFQSDTKVSVFLISLKAGGFGLNLTAADYVFLLDPWWNPAVERQAQDRSHRIGQEKNVFIYKFITKDTIEEKILSLQDRKTKLAESIITAEESLLKKIKPNELLELLS